MWWVADLGNRCLKLAPAGRDGPGPLHRFPLEELGQAPPPGSGSGLLYVSVRPEAESALAAWARRWCRGPLLKLGRDRPWAVATDCQGVGGDRLATARGAARRAPGGAIVVDAGTAVTVDAVSPDGCFLGGAILPGRRLWLEALAAGAALLPKVAPAPAALPARQTADCLRAGLAYGWPAAVAAVAAALRAALPFEPVLFLTGGEAEALLGALPGARVVPQLTLEGVWCHLTDAERNG